MAAGAVLAAQLGLVGMRLHQDPVPADALEEVAVAEDHAVVGAHLDEEPVGLAREIFVQPAILAVLRLKDARTWLPISVITFHHDRLPPHTRRAARMRPR